MPVVSPLPELLENRQPVIVTAHSLAIPSKRHLGGFFGVFPIKRAGQASGQGALMRGDRTAAGACLPSRHPRVLLVARRACIYATSAPSIMFALLPACRRDTTACRCGRGRRLPLRSGAASYSLALSARL